MKEITEWKVVGRGRAIFWYNSRLCYIFQISRNGYRLHFFPTKLSAILWIDSLERVHDEVFLERLLREGDIFIDVGANIGTHTLKAASLIKSNGRVYAYEPRPTVFGFLQKNIHLNGFINIEVFNVALGEKEGVLRFSDLKSDDQNSISKQGAIAVNIEKLDDYNISKVDLI